MICEDGSRVVVVPVVVEPVVVPAPRAVVPIQVADIDVAILVAVIYNVPPFPPPLESRLSRKAG